MFVCNNCGNESLKWQGQCGACKEWNTLVEFQENKDKKTARKGQKQPLQSLNEEHLKVSRIVTKSEEFNTVTGGGIVPGSIILLSGEPGIGKSTLSLQIAGWLEDKKVLYVSGEETLGQISTRAHRLGIVGKNLEVLCESNLEDIIVSIEKEPFQLIIFDSISVMQSTNASGIAGSINQIKYIGEILQQYAKNTNTSLILIGHVTKDGNVAGPKSLEHLVDTVLFFEGERFDDIRILRSLKNRFGSTGDIGIFKMEESGLKDVSQPGLELTNTAQSNAQIGSALSITLEGNRPLLIECEALTTYTKFGYPKRSTRGINTSKLDMIIAILGKYTGAKLESYDVYANIARGLRIEDPAIDMSIAAAVISSKAGVKIDRKTLFVGEISLTGNIKNVIQLEKRVKEAEKLGFTKVIIPKGTQSLKSKIEIVEISHITQLQKHLGIE